MTRNRKMLFKFLVCRVFEPENRLSLVVVPTPRRACFPENAPARRWQIGTQRRGDGLPGRGRAAGADREPDTTGPAGDAGILARAFSTTWATRRGGCAQAHQQLKEEPGLDHFEGGRWRGLLRHGLVAPMAFCLLQHQRLAAVRQGKKVARPPRPGFGAPARASRSHRPSRAAALSRLPGPLQPAAASYSANVGLEAFRQPRL